MLEQLLNYINSLGNNIGVRATMAMFVEKVRLQVIAHPVNINQDEVSLFDMTFSVEQVTNFFGEVPAVLAILRQQAAGKSKAAILKKLFGTIIANAPKLDVGRFSKLEFRMHAGKIPFSKDFDFTQAKQFIEQIKAAYAKLF